MEEIAINESRLREIVHETVSDVLKRIGAVNEMAVPLKAYRSRVDGLRFQLVENWCLCRWCQLYDAENKHLSHLASELKACIDNLKYLDIKNGIDKNRVLTRMLIQDYDYNDSGMIERIIRGKFLRENITDEVQKAQVCNDFAEGIESLIAAIADNARDSYEYIQGTFNFR